MENENEYPQVDAVEEEEQAEETEQQDVVTIPKEKFTHMQRKAIAYDKMKKAPKPLETNREPIDEDVVKTVKNLEQIEKKRQFGYENGLSPEETDVIFNLTGGNLKKEILESPFVKAGLEGFRSAKRLDSNTPSTTHGSSIFQGKNFNEMTQDERKASYEAQAKKFKVA